ncbi:uncharacterized protein [Rutidosis leptorrhynchoides]|uniref:uncharacterized protein n=1 Tax=Rutidosis leptorrhynchoides TaxID=125765 RepID=UPI003A997865
MSPNETTPVRHLSLRSVLEKEKLNNTNFLDWYHNLRIVLKVKKKSYILDGLIPEEPPANATKSIRDAWTKHTDDSIEVACLMLDTMISDLQKDLEHHDAFEMLKQLKEMFQQQAKQQRFETVRALHACKMAEGTSISFYVLKMKSYIDQLERLGSSIGPELAIDLILNSLRRVIVLPKSYDQFVLNYNMNNWEKSISELHLMLKNAEKNIPSKTSEVLMIREGKIKKPQAKGKGKSKHKSQGNTKGLRKIKKLKPGDLVLHVGNGAHVAVVAIGISKCGSKSARQNDKGSSIGLRR